MWDSLQGSCESALPGNPAAITPVAERLSGGLVRGAPVPCPPSALDRPQRRIRMSLLGFGQPLTGVFQMCYLVEDIEASMRHWVEQLNVGPWFLLEHFTGERGTYRGEPAD